MLSMPMSIPRLSITQTIIEEENIEKENDPITESSEQASTPLQPSIHQQND